MIGTRAYLALVAARETLVIFLAGKGTLRTEIITFCVQQIIALFTLQTSVVIRVPTS